MLIKKGVLTVGIFFLGYFAFSCSSNKSDGSSAQIEVGDTIGIKFSGNKWEISIPRDSGTIVCYLMAELKASKPDTPWSPQALSVPDTQWSPSASSRPDTQWVQQKLVVEKVYTDCED